MLRNQNDVGAAGDPSIRRNPSCVAAHHLNHHYPVVRFSGRVQTIDRVSDDRYRGVKTKGEVGAADVVVNCFGNPYDAESMISPKIARSGERSLAADYDESRKLQLCPINFNPRERVAIFQRVCARGPEDGSASREDADHCLPR